MTNERNPYDIDNEEYRALFKRIEDGGKRFAQDAEREQNIKREYVEDQDELDFLDDTAPDPVRSTRSMPDNGRAPQHAKKKPNHTNKNAKSGGMFPDFGAVAESAKNLFKKDAGKGEKMTAPSDGKKASSAGAAKTAPNGKKKVSLLKKLYKSSVVTFAACLVLFGFISAVDKNKTVSEEENRALAEKPKFSFSSLFSGKYTVEFENFYSDNFPARSFFISCNNKISDVFTRFSAGDDGEVMISTEKKDEDFIGEGVDLLGDKKKQGMKENTAAVTPDSEASIQGSILIAGNRALEIYYHSDENAKNYASIISKTAKAMPEGVKFYSMLCPTAIEFYGTAQYREGVHSQRDSIQKIYSMYDPAVITVDAYSNLVDKVTDYIYFRTDHHWTARGAYCGYKAFCDVSGNTATPLESFATHKLDGFVGSLYKTSQASVLKENPDYVECFDLSVDAQNMVYPTKDMISTDGVPTYVVAREVNDSNKYLAFIAGDQPLEKITTSVKNGKKALVIKESYGNAFVPFLCNNYEEVYVTDPRWINMNLTDFVATNGINDVIAVNYMFAIGNKTYCNALNSMTN